MTIAMDKLSSPGPCNSVAPSNRRLPHDRKWNGACASLLLRAVSVGPASPDRAQERAEPVPARVLIRWLASDPGAAPPMLKGSDGPQIRADLGFGAIPHVFPTAR